VILILEIDSHTNWAIVSSISHVAKACNPTITISYARSVIGTRIGTLPRRCRSLRNHRN
jgi:hypothetical protein